MKRRMNNGWCWLVGVFAALMMGMAQATPFPNPDPASYLDDLEGDGLFVMTDGSFILELTDLGESIDPTLANSFGFYFSSDPGTLIEIFDTGDSVGQAASIDLAAGKVIDFDEAADQSTFTTGSMPVGFYVMLNDTIAATLGLPTSILFTEPARNFGIDYFGAFPAISAPLSELRLSAMIVPATAAPIDIGSFYLIGAKTTSVPEPSLLYLLALGLVVLQGLHYLTRRRIDRA